MKTTGWIFLVSLFIWNCQTKSEEVQSEDKHELASIENYVDLYKADSTTIKLFVGEKIGFHVDENASTGYTWKTELSDSCAIEIVKESYLPQENIENLVGAGSTKTYEIQGKSPGKCTVVFLKNRDWEEERGQEVVINFEVR
ncbi:protease inhibitor I42 family protein [Moheibacter stercoris]|uniref:Secreted protein n=1 Tax=Moheibacter stercoris TaxID=1628251 RepID=A0ABV2LUU5_9FLAO